MPREDPDAALLDVEKHPTNNQSLTMPEVLVFLEENVQTKPAVSGSKKCVGRCSYGSVYLGIQRRTRSTIVVKEQIADYLFVETEAAIQLYLQPTGRILPFMAFLPSWMCPVELKLLA